MCSLKPSPPGVVLYLGGGNLFGGVCVLFFRGDFCRAFRVVFFSSMERCPSPKEAGSIYSTGTQSGLCRAHCLVVDFRFSGFCKVARICIGWRDFQITPKFVHIQNSCKNRDDVGKNHRPNCHHFTLRLSPQFLKRFLSFLAFFCTQFSPSVPR